MKIFLRTLGICVVFMLSVSLIRANDSSIAYKQPLTFEYVLQQLSEVKLIKNVELSNSNWLVLLKNTVNLLGSNNSSYFANGNYFSFLLSKIGESLGKFIVAIFSGFDMIINFLINTVNIVYGLFNAFYGILFGYVV